MNKLPNRLKSLRIKYSITQEKLANDISEFFGYPISKGTISQYENGNREPNISMLINFSQYFNCSIDYLIGVSDHKSLIDSKSMMDKLMVLKTFVNIIPQIDYVQLHELNTLLSNYLESNNLND